jgi:hypothetical protein
MDAFEYQNPDELRGENVDMKPDLDGLLARDSCFFDDVVSEYHSRFARIVSDSGFVQTGKALHILFSQCTLIKNAIFRSAGEQDPHTMMILYRSFIEHFLKHNYICIKSRRDGNDTVGVQYYDHCLVKNELDTIHGIQCSKDLFSSGFRYPEAWAGAEHMSIRRRYDVDELKEIVS